MKFKDYYQILGVARDASKDDIRRAYRRLARKYHPDVSKEKDAEVRFKEMKEAYEVLKDPEKRAAYDQFGSNWKAGQDFQPPPGWQQEHAFRAGGAGHDFFGGAEQFSDFFETLFGGGRGGFEYRRGRMRARGEDANASISIPIEDAYRGASRTISLDVSDPETGTGRKRRTLNVRIPAGITAGKRIRLEGQGGPGIGGSPSGDLYLTVQLEPHPHYRADGRDIYLTLPVTPWEAALGRKVKVPTLGGPVDLRIPAGSDSGKTLRLKGRGLPGDPPGDQYVELSVMVPPVADERTRELYESLERGHDVNPRAKLGV